MGAIDSLLTDQECVLQLLEKNVQANLAEDENAESKIRVHEFTWGSSTDELDGPFDFILVSDCINSIYGEDSWLNLAKSIADLTDTDLNTTTYMSTQVFVS